MNFKFSQFSSSWETCFSQEKCLKTNFFFHLFSWEKGPLGWDNVFVLYFKIKKNSTFFFSLGDFHKRRRKFKCTAWRERKIFQYINSNSNSLRTRREKFLHKKKRIFYRIFISLPTNNPNPNPTRKIFSFSFHRK